MKFQDSSFKGLKVTVHVGTKSVTHPRTHPRSKNNMPHQLFQSWGHNQGEVLGYHQGFRVGRGGGVRVDVNREVKLL